MGFRLKIALLIGGGVLAFFGGQEFLVSYGTSDKPLEVDLDLDKVLILEAGRKPASLGKSLGMIFGGGFLLIAGVVSLCWNKITSQGSGPHDEWEASVQEPSESEFDDQDSKDCFT